MTRKFVSSLIALVIAGCATAPSRDLAPGERPELNTTEAGLWMAVDSMEGELRKSGRLVDDPELHSYLQSLVCDLGPEHCAQIRVYVVEVPLFNASMSPNGMMQVWTGLLLRTENESQLAFVLAHELGHYTKRHTIKRWVDLQNKANASATFGILAAAAGVGYVGYLGQMAALASISAFSRDQEREADDVGLETLVATGHEPGQAAAIWQNLLEERSASPKDEPSIFMATHPGIEERIARIEKSWGPPMRNRAPSPGDLRLREVTAPHLDDWLGDEVSRGEYADSVVLLSRLLSSDRPRGLVLSHLGDVRRKQGGDASLRAAVDLYREAAQEDGAPPRLHRNLGQALIRLDRRAEARSELETYLALVPDATDKAFIESQIKGLR